jgi:tRNA(Ile)-lysidine synthase
MILDSRSQPAFWTALHARLHYTLRSRQLLTSHQRLLIAVSGGQDSLCLLQLLCDLRSKWHWELAIAHCDHRWRVDSQANADHIQQLAEERQLPFYSQTALSSLSSEAQARQWRYQVLTEIAQTQSYPTIATGHTASDRAETLLYNLIRGSGLDGLQALTWQRPLTPSVQLVRPLLAFTRAETAQFCQDRRLPIWKDSTNDDWHHARNRIRQELLPYLQTHFNPQAEGHLAQTAELLQAEVAYLESTAEQLRQQVQHPEQPGLHRLTLRSAPLALQRRVIRTFLQEYLPKAPHFEQVEKIQALVTAPNRTQTDPFPGGAIACVEGDWIWLRLGN